MTDDLVPDGHLLANVLQALSDAVVVADAEGRVLLVNDEVERLSRYARDDLVGRSIDLLIPVLGDDQGERLRLAADGHAIGLSVRLRRCDRVEVPVGVTLRGLATGDGARILAVMRGTAPGHDGEIAALGLLVEQRQRIADRISEVIERLFSVGMSLQYTAQRSRQPELTEQLERDVEDIDSTVRDLRATIFALYR